MKIKKLLPLFTVLVLTFFYNYHLFSNSKIEKYLNQTPAQFSSMSIYYYLNNQAHNKKYKNLNLNENKSRTTIFNNAFSKYIKEIYNNKYYSNFLSQDGSHIIEFLQLSKELNLETESIYTCLRLFYNKIKACEIVDDTVALQILKPLPNLIKKHISPKYKPSNDLKFLKKSIEKTIIFKFTDHIKDFQREPNIFLSELSKDISKIAKTEILQTQKTTADNEIKTRLRVLIIKFLEITFNKLMWDLKSYESIWESVLEIANNLINLSEHKIIDHIDDFDDLLWSLTHRFCYFLNISGSYLPVNFYEEIENDIASGTAFFLEIEEQDDGIKTKKEILLSELISAKTKAIAFERNGIFSDQLI